MYLFILIHEMSQRMSQIIEISEKKEKIVGERKFLLKSFV